MLQTVYSLLADDLRISERCPSCKAPIVGTNPILCPIHASGSSVLRLLAKNQSMSRAPSPYRARYRAPPAHLARIGQGLVRLVFLMKLTPARAPAQYFAQYVLLAPPCSGFWLENQSTACVDGPYLARYWAPPARLARIGHGIGHRPRAWPVLGTVLGNARAPGPY